MAEFTENRDFSTVTLVDRTGRGGAEIIYDGVRITFPQKKVEKAVPRFVANWLFRVSQQMVWTEDGQYVNRFGIKDMPEDLVQELGPEAGDTSLIVLDATRHEGWDTSGVDRSEARTVELTLPSSAMRERQGLNTTTFGDRKD